VSTGDADQEAQLQALAAEFGALDFFCINDTTDDAQHDDPRLRHVQSVLQAMLPKASAFEQPAQHEGAVSTGVGVTEAAAAEIHQGAQAPAAHQSPVSGARRRA
jgi:hypothetical protein